MAAKKLQSLSNNVSRFEMPQTGIPIIIRPFVVKKAYVVHPKATTFQADLKAQWLTKTCLIKGFPSTFRASDSEIPEERLKYIKEITEKSLLQTMVSQRIGLKWKMRYDADLIDGVLQNLLLPCWHLVDHTRASFFDYRPSIQTHWCRNHNFYQHRFQVASVLRTATALPVFEKGKHTPFGLHLICASPVEDGGCGVRILNGIAHLTLAAYQLAIYVMMIKMLQPAQCNIKNITISEPAQWW